MFGLITNHKKIYDNIHGFINISNWAAYIIDTKYFQRLRYLHQLGTCYLVFPSATHTRFEHSLGTYYLVGELLRNIKRNTDTETINKCLIQIPNLKTYFNDMQQTDLLNDELCEIIKIAGLCHDLGHGPFSHLFEDVFQNNISHEHRSCMILEKIIETTDLKEMFNQTIINFIKDLINPQENNKGFVYQIVSNYLNDIDMDKCDYICRDTYTVGLKYSADYRIIINDVIVIDNVVCYPKQLSYELICLFTTRYRLHKQVYGHKSVIVFDHIISQIIRLLDPIFDLSDHINNLNKLSNITDYYVLNSVIFLNDNIHLYDEKYHDNIKCTKKLLDRINSRNLYKYIGTIISENELTINHNTITQIDSTLDDKFIICKKTIGYISGNKDNPLDNIYFYDKNDKNKAFIIDKQMVTKLSSSIYKEHLVMLFSITKDQVIITKLTNIYNNLLNKID